MLSFVFKELLLSLSHLFEDYAPLMFFLIITVAFVRYYPIMESRQFHVHRVIDNTLLPSIVYASLYVFIYSVEYVVLSVDGQSRAS
jgi:hypothetical protein